MSFDSVESAFPIGPKARQMRGTARDWFPKLASVRQLYFHIVRARWCVCVRIFLIYTWSVFFTLRRILHAFSRWKRSFSHITQWIYAVVSGDIKRLCFLRLWRANNIATLVLANYRERNGVGLLRWKISFLDNVPPRILFEKCGFSVKTGKAPESAL